MRTNDIMIWLLTSPAHGLVSHNTMLLHLHGKKSGNLYHIPVNYVRVDDVLYVVSNRDRTWWRNLRGGADLSLHLKGKNIRGYGTVLEETFSVVDALRAMIREEPFFARVLRIRRDNMRKLNDEDLLRVANERVVARFQLGVETYKPDDDLTDLETATP
jgi:hypothetical protein